jgi:hypothetical protein
MRSNKILENMVGGEISPLMYGRVDAPIYQKALAKMENFLALPQGGAQFRNGTVFVTNTRLNQEAALYPFQFSDQQGYTVEATPLKFRFYADSGIIVGNDTLITAITKANPAVVTDTAHGYLNGDIITIAGVQGMVEVNGGPYTIAGKTANTYQLSGVNSTGFTTYSSGGAATQVINISAITNANPGVFTATHHQYANGDAVFISGVKGLVGLDTQQYLVAGSTANTFTLTDIFGVPINTTLMGAYTGGGIAQRIFEIATNIEAADIHDMQYAQSADTLYMVNQNYAPRKLVRKSNALWTYATFVRTGTDPFAAVGDFPRCVSFDSAGRLWYGGTKNDPQTIFGSDAPSGGTTHFDRFTVTPVTATTSVQFTLAPLFSGKVDFLEWISNTNQFMVLGTFGSVRSLWGAAQGSPVTPTAITSLPANVLGCSFTLPVANGDSLFYVQRGSQRLRSLEYDFYISGFTTKDQSLGAEHLTGKGLSRIIQQRGLPDLLWALRPDGRFLGFTYSRPEQENYASWHRHYLGGNSVQSGVTVPLGTVTSMSTAPRSQTTDQLWFAVKRKIGANTVCSVEYLADYQPYPNAHDFFTNDQAGDTRRFTNSLYQVQKNAVYLDMASLYDGSLLGFNANVTLTPSATSGAAITITASAAIFEAAMVGREIHKAYDALGNGGGRAIITGFTSTTQVTANVTVPFDNTAAMLAGAWYLTATSISGLTYLNGETIQVTADGGPLNDATVANGKITLVDPATTVVAGYKYLGTLETLNIDSGGRLGPAQSKPRNLIRSAVRFLNSIGTQFGTSYYKLDQLPFRTASFQTDRPTPPYTGIKMIHYQDTWTDSNNDPQKKVVIVQNQALPCTVLGIDNYLMTTDE